MKKEYSLRDFHKKVSEISGNTIDLCRVVVEINLYNKITFSCYVDGLNKIFEGSTMEESLDKLHQSVNHSAPVNLIDVEIDF